MTLSVGEVVTVILAFFGILGIVAGAWVVVRARLVTKVAENWQATAESLEARFKEYKDASIAKIKDLESELLTQETYYKAMETELRSRIEALEMTNLVLQDTVSGKSAILEFREELLVYFEKLERILEQLLKRYNGG